MTPLKAPWERGVLAELQAAAAAKWSGDPAAHRAGLFARAAAEIEQLNAALAAQPATGHGLTDQAIEEAVQEAGGRWNGSWWVFEDADLHPFVRSLLARAHPPVAQPAGNAWEKEQLRVMGRNAATQPAESANPEWPQERVEAAAYSLGMRYQTAQPAAEPDERTAFEAWWATERQRTWIAAGCDKDRGSEPSENWSKGFKRHAWSGWQARAMKARP